jgi:hypothetical protein
LRGTPEQEEAYKRASDAATAAKNHATAANVS